MSTMPLIINKLDGRWIDSDPVSAWRERFNRVVKIDDANTEPVFIPFSNLYNSIEGFFHVLQNNSAVLFEYDMAVVEPSSGAAYSFDSGIALAGSYLQRMPNGMQTPHCQSFYCEPTWHWRGIDMVEEPCLYIPFSCFSNFGHFVTETISYLWPFALDSDLPPFDRVIFGGSSSHRFAELISLFIKRAGYEAVFEERLPPRFLAKKLYIPSLQFSLHCHISKLYINTANSIGSFIIDQDQPSQALGKEMGLIYISRSGLPASHRKIDNEENIEAILAGNGWKIIHPEELSLSQQIEVLSNATVIAGFEGSAFHALALSDIKHKKPLVIILGDALSPDFLMQFSAQGLNGYYAKCSRPSVNIDVSALHTAARSLLYAPSIIADSLQRIACTHLNQVDFL